MGRKGKRKEWPRASDGGAWDGEWVWLWLLLWVVVIVVGGWRER